MKINQVTPAEIGRLDPAQLVRLLHLLLHAEARKREIARPGIHVPFRIVVADGGEDGRWDAELSGVWNVHFSQSRPVGKV
jgi:hypothetical protein